MDKKFTVSAPGKIILNGEHSVVYGKPALAGVVGIRNYVTLTENSTEALNINLDIFPNENTAISLSAINQFIHKIHSEYETQNLPDGFKHDAFLSEVQKFVQENALKGKSNISPNFEKTISAIIYLFAALLSNSSPDETAPKLSTGLTLDFKSGITMGAGLGSSASFAVCVAGAFYVYGILRNQPDFLVKYHTSATEDEKSYMRTIVSAWAFCSERIMHGTPSGLDNSICTFGNVVKFYKGAQLLNINLKSTINILLVNSAVSRSTAQIVKQVADLRNEYPTMINHILDGMGELVENVEKVLEDAKLSDAQKYEKLKLLFTLNNNLLRAINVSHPVLETIFMISEQNGFACKLTGAGAGGYAIVLLPPSYSDLPNFKKLCDELTANNFSWDVTTIGGSGFEISE